MANVCERCKHSMSIHDNHASCPQCQIAAGECSLDLDKPCGICANWTRRQWGKLCRSLIDARARSTQRGRQHWSIAFPRLEAWILSKPVSTSASEISSQAGEEDFEDNVLASTPKQQVEQVFGCAGSADFWLCRLKTGSTWRLVCPLRHPVRPSRLKVRHQVRLPCR